MTWDVVTTDHLNSELLIALRQERLAAVRVPGFCDPDARRRIADLLAQHPDRTNYSVRWS